MALVIEDGSIVSGADSYITIAEYTAWADARFTNARSTRPVDDAGYEALIYRAMDYFEGLDFKGYLVIESQPLQFPRAGLYIDGYLVDKTTIPKEVKTALYELTYSQETGEGALNVVGRKTTRFKAGPVEEEYAESSSASNISPSHSMSLKKLVRGAGSMQVYRV